MIESRDSGESRGRRKHHGGEGDLHEAVDGRLGDQLPVADPDAWKPPETVGLDQPLQHRVAKRSQTAMN